MVTALGWCLRYRLMVGETFLVVPFGYAFGLAFDRPVGFDIFGVELLMVQVFVMCLGMFLIHTLAAAEVNHNAKTLGGVVNGLYVSAYYAGGAFGAWVTGYVYEVFGWTAFISTLACVGLIGLFMMLRYRRLSTAGAR